MGASARRGGPPRQRHQHADHAPVKRKGGGLPLLPIIVGAIILDQAVFNGRYSREALNWIMKFVEGFSR